MPKRKPIRPKDRKTKLQISFGENVRAMRLKMDLSQEGLADLAGLHFTYVSSLERGERNVSIANIAKIAKALGCQMRDLMPSQ